MSQKNPLFTNCFQEEAVLSFSEIITSSGWICQLIFSSSSNGLTLISLSLLFQKQYFNYLNKCVLYA